VRRERLELSVEGIRRCGPSLHRGGLLRAEPRRALNSCLHGHSGGRANIVFAHRLSDYRVYSGW
jgi:hypothetical protein